MILSEYINSPTAVGVVAPFVNSIAVFGHEWQHREDFADASAKGIRTGGLFWAESEKKAYMINHQYAIDAINYINTK